MYKITFIDKENKRYDFCEFGLCEGEQFLDKLEEVLYIMQELTPVHRHWKQDLMTVGACLFTYHNTEHVVVQYRSPETEIWVRDI